jgi:hypothetical protein
VKTYVVARQESRVRIAYRMGTFVPAFLIAVQAWAGVGLCHVQTHCRAKGHNTIAASDFPYTEDIAGGSADTPVPDPLTLSGPATSLTEIEGGCTDLGGINLAGTQPFNALLRAMVQVQSATAAPGARFFVELVVDGQPWGQFVRRLRGGLPQFDVFTATATNLAAGGHSFSVLAALLDPGTMTVSNTYSNALGSPATYPAVTSADPAQLTLDSAYFRPVTETVSFANTQAVDFVVQGSFEVNSGITGQPVNLAPFLDGVRQAPVGTIAVPPYLPESVNFLSVLPAVPPGSHTLEWRAATNGQQAVFANRAIDGVAFPASTYQVLAQTTSKLTVQSLRNPMTPQPRFLDTTCGYWTRVLGGTIAADSGSYNTLYEGFVRLTGARTGASSYGQLWFESYFPDVPTSGTDGGTRGFALADYGDGIYIVGDTMAWAAPHAETINLWARKVNPICSAAGGFGTFDVGSRFIWVRHIPITPKTCFYN